ncbi:MAG: protein tyrosine phosphatase [Hyphomicrobiales bacterium]|nr:MAG: protein tyrosine phosphatase [Hyphomicrobiales bacterium]
MPDDILVVCIANTCRSPMMDLLLQKALPQKNITSAGINANIDQPMNEYSAKLTAKLGIDCTGHKARQLTLQICQANQLIMVMEKCHIKDILSIDPTAKDKLVLVGKWQGDIEIMDPYGQNFEIYEKTFQLIKKAAFNWIKKLAIKS